MSEEYQRLCKEKADIEYRLNSFANREEKAWDTSNQGAALVGCTRPMLTNDEIVRHHNPTPPSIQKIGAIRLAAKNFLDTIDANCPPHCADTSDAKRKVREAMMTANAAIVLDGAV